MSVPLFEHNQVAYQAAIAMMDEMGKAAVIHPTGTGKSFIGLKLAQDNPGCRICWLGPSEYIYRTQLVNWRSAGGGEARNVQFLTYTRLMGLNSDQVTELAPAYIILDEFHRCGAEQWGGGVARLLEAHPNVPVLGLSATNIRYLDNQRDMADELFDGNVASEMTLGEAIVRGILAAPKYVVACYSLQKDLERFQRRAQRAKSPAVRDIAEQYLEALRRALGKADGLDVVFQRHMADPKGKYIVFCSDVDHMSQLLERVPEWFSKVDPEPHVYQAFSDNPETSAAFDRFRSDHSDHLKLLYCIDMLNEGIHVDEVSGVILCRPTVSPIIYKQQIGRALSAGGQEEPVIFDIVNNFENLYSIGTITQEIGEVLAYYRDNGKEREIVQERFRVFDEVRDCRRLFESLQETLTASWDLMYQQARQYFEEHGNLNVPKRYKTKQGYSLGSWIMTQRKVKAGKQYGSLSESRIHRLDLIGMVWENRLDSNWEQNLEEARQYRKIYGDLDIEAAYVSPSGVRLGAWICNLRQYRVGGVRGVQLTPERIAVLDQLGMIWDKNGTLWERNYRAAQAFYRKNGHLEVPARYVDEKGIALGCWLDRQRKARQKNQMGAVGLTNERIARLDQIGMDWNKRHDISWMRYYAAAKAYVQTYGNLNIPSTYKSDGMALGKWLARQRDIDKLPEWKVALLKEIGMDWSVIDSWEKRFALAKEYFEVHGDLKMPSNYIIDGIWLHKWLNEQRQIYQGKRQGRQLTMDQINRLEAISFDWLSTKERVWEMRYGEARRVYEATGGLEEAEGVVPDVSVFKRWLQEQRRAYYNQKLTQQQIQRLNELHFQWTSLRQAVPSGIRNKTTLFSNSGCGALTQEQMKRLDAPGTHTTSGV